MNEPMSEQKYSWTFKQKMVRRLTGANAVSATQLAKEPACGR